MEFEISDNPQDEQEDERDDRDDSIDREIIDDHSALKNQSSIKPEEYPLDDRRAQSLVNKKG